MVIQCILTRMGFWGALREAGGPDFTKLILLRPENLYLRIYSPAGLAIALIGTALPGTRTKHQLCVLDFGCCMLYSLLGIYITCRCAGIYFLYRPASPVISRLQKSTLGQGHAAVAMGLARCNRNEYRNCRFFGGGPASRY